MAKPELVYVNMLELGLKLLGSFGHNFYSLLVVAIDNWSNASVELKPGEEIVPLDKF